MTVGQISTLKEDKGARSKLKVSKRSRRNKSRTTKGKWTLLTNLRRPSHFRPIRPKAIQQQPITIPISVPQSTKAATLPALKMEEFRQQLADEYECLSPVDDDCKTTDDWLKLRKHGE